MRDSEIPDQELPGMWEHSDFIGGRTDDTPPKKTTVKVRERPALYSVPFWNEKGDGIEAAVEEYRNQRKKYSTWEIEVRGWPGESQIIGLVWEGRQTHYAFYLEDVLANPHLENGIHFDAGTSCRELFVESDEWKRVLNELNIITGDSTVQSEGKADK